LLVFNNRLKNKKARMIAFYLPQFHPIPENDAWWGKGFTEWTNVTKAKPLFDNHYQPHLPADLGYYDLRLTEARQAQADLAKSYGIEGFCYWHYWFGNGKRLLERPFQEVLKSGEPDLGFFLGWANQTWSGIWHGSPDRVLMEQTYPGEKDYEEHFYYLLNAFHDERYMTVGGKKIFLVYAPQLLPDSKAFTDQWRRLAEKEGLKGIHFIAHGVADYEKYGCDACVDNAPFIHMPQRRWQKKHPKFARVIDNIKYRRRISLERLPTIHSYAEFVDFIKHRKLRNNEYPIIIPNWDNTPRAGLNGFVLHGSTPELFKKMLKDAVNKIDAAQAEDPENKLIFIKAWNEWAESNHLEPDTKFGHAYLEVIKEVLQ